MPPITSNDDAPASRAHARPRGAFVLAALGLVLGLAALAPYASAQRPKCDLSCGDPNNLTDDCVSGPCQEFRDCQLEYREIRQTCIEDECLGGVIQPGNCDFALNCSLRCLPNENCAPLLQDDLESACGDCRVGRGTARRACNRCVEQETPPACQSLLSDGTGSKCQQQCIHGTPWIAECYKRCEDRCTKDRCVIAICRRGCRDSVCNNLVARCVGTGTEQKKSGYQGCCLSSDGECSKDSVESLTCKSTSTSSTSTTTSTSGTSTSSTSTTVRTSTTRPGGGITTSTLRSGA